MGESNTDVSASTMYRHLQQYCSHPLVEFIHHIGTWHLQQYCSHPSIESIQCIGTYNGIALTHRNVIYTNSLTSP